MLLAIDLICIGFSHALVTHEDLSTADDKLSSGFLRQRLLPHQGWDKQRTEPLLGITSGTFGSSSISEIPSDEEDQAGRVNQQARSS